MKNKKTKDAVAVTETALTNRKSKWRLLGKQKMLIAMSVPFVLYVILFRYIPLWGWTMGFQRYKPQLSFGEQEWVGFHWFAELFKPCRLANAGFRADVSGSYRSSFGSKIRANHFRSLKRKAPLCYCSNTLFISFINAP